MQRFGHKFGMEKSVYVNSAPDKVCSIKLDTVYPNHRDHHTAFTVISETHSKFHMYTSCTSTDQHHNLGLLRLIPNSGIFL